MPRIPALVVASLVTACSSPEIVVDALVPAGTDRLAILAESSDGALVLATPIQRVTPGEATRVEAGEVALEGTLLSVLGWSSAALGGLAVEDSPLRRARVAESTLPDPTFAVRGVVVDGRVAPAPIRSDDLPRLSSATLDSCPIRVKADALVDSSCNAVGCFPRLAQTGCALDLELLACGLGEARGVVDSAGIATIEATSLVGPCAEEAVEGVDLALRCERLGRDACRVDAIDPARAVAPFGEAERVTLVTPTSTRTPRLSTVMEGYLGATVALDDRLLIAATPDRASDVWCTATASQLLVVEAATLKVTTPTTTYTCLTAMTRDPIGSGVLAAFGGPQRPQIGRFDREGRLTETLPIDTRGLSVTRLAASAHSGLLFAALSDPRVDGGVVVALSALTGDEVWRAATGGERYVDLQAFDDEVIALDEGAGFVYAYRAVDGTFRLAAPIGLACGIQGADPVRVWPFRGPNRWVVTSIRDGAEVLVLSSVRSTGCESAIAYATPDAEPLAIAPYPGDVPERLMVGLWTRGGDAVLARLDARGNRFLPGLVRLGRGHVGELASVGGRVFATLPQTGELVRVQPAP